MLSEFKCDLRRYPSNSLILQPALWAIFVYRFGRWSMRCSPLMRKPAHAVYFAAYSLVRLLTGIDIPRSASVGPGLMIHHFGGIIIHPEARIGANCTLRHGVTIGKRRDADPVPVVEDNVSVGAYAQVLGDIVIGAGATIGAMSVVLKDVAPGATVVGNPARAISPAKHIPQ